MHVGLIASRRIGSLSGPCSGIAAIGVVPRVGNVDDGARIVVAGGGAVIEKRGAVIPFCARSEEWNGREEEGD